MAGLRCFPRVVNNTLPPSQTGSSGHVRENNTCTPNTALPNTHFRKLTSFSKPHLTFLRTYLTFLQTPHSKNQPPSISTEHITTINISTYIR